ncbi:collagen alpha-1(xii) chain [Plakobranchus ocellatus]|uniref:Collagen alpha-1(Xii) chain n=1 Tax=Plakobranchus ocellatus TaxID=259542 RepID=A0AAV4B6U6_9GAST|nr:collagen alpha-1(xii) chain [Plakobranchus ocellatus]
MASLTLFAVVVLLGSVHCQFEPVEIPAVCEEKEMDIYFLLDSSTSIYINDYRKELDFVRDVVNNLDISTAYTRVGVITFSDNPTTPSVLSLTGFQNRGDIRNNVNENNLPYLTGLTYTDRAIRYVRQLPTFRRNIVKAMVVITDGESRDQGATAREAELAREAGFYMFVVGVGQYRDEQEWRAIATNPDERFMWNITSFQQLTNVAYSLPTRACPLPPLVQRACDVTRRAEVSFVAGAAASRRVFEVIEDMAQNTVDRGNRLAANFFIPSCPSNLLGVSLDDHTLCSSGFPSRNTAGVRLFELIQQAKIRAAEGDSFTTQVIVAFLDYDVNDRSRRYGLEVANELKEALDDGTKVVLVTTDFNPYENNIATVLSGRDFRSVAFSSGTPISDQQDQLKEALDFTCEAINYFPSFNPARPN